MARWSVPGKSGPSMWPLSRSRHAMAPERFSRHGTPQPARCRSSCTETCKSSAGASPPAPQPVPHGIRDGGQHLHSLVLLFSRKAASRAASTEIQPRSESPAAGASRRYSRRKEGSWHAAPRRVQISFSSCMGVDAAHIEARAPQFRLFLGLSGCKVPKVGFVSTFLQKV